MRVVVIVLLGITTAGHCQTKTNDWSKRIISKTKRPLASLINPHVSYVNVLTIDKKRFEHVRGVKRFYLPVPQTNAIVFMVDEKDYSVTYHVFNMDTDEDIAIHAQDSVFGQSIGSSRPQDAVEDVRDGRIVLSTRSGPNTITKTLIQLDLTKKAVVAEKTLFYDQAGKVIRQQDRSPSF